jgi:septal ring factor EnvC (AmiA/AmiB activator)
LLDQANMVEILHDDGTIGVYAHLHWDSVRVRPGQHVQHVQRGEYIADSGNTVSPPARICISRSSEMPAWRRYRCRYNLPDRVPRQ